MRRLTAALLVLVASSVGTVPATGSGDPGPFTVLVDRHGGSPEEREHLYEGRMGVLITSASDSLLYLQWRLLNGLEVGNKVGPTLTASCCDEPDHLGEDDGVIGWAKATRLVPGIAAAPEWLPTGLPGPRYTEIPNCFRDAFDSAAETLRDRVSRYGARNPAVRAWLTTQNAVFAACSSPAAALPPPMADAPAWLKADRAYQEAAFALYKGRNADAFYRFRAIGNDPGSPWQPRGLYLGVRALQRQAFKHPGPQTFAVVRTGIARLEARTGAYGRSEVRRMLRALAYRDQPDVLFRELDQELHARAPAEDLARSLRDYLSLSATRSPRPEIVDWLTTLRGWERDEAFAHAQERWTATRKTYWLLAALALVRTGDPQANALAADAASVPQESPGWLSAQYHNLRLTFASGDAASMRRRVDAILARDLSASDRNLFRGLRTQLATSLPDMMRFALRDAFCTEDAIYCRGSDWILADEALARRPGGQGFVTLGHDSRAILDRLPLRTRMAAGANLPRAIRLDLALTNFGRAVQLQDDAAIDRLAGELAGLLPQIRKDWLAIRRARPGPAKRFAEFFVLAKIPGAASDLIDYTRPQGTVRQWQGRWREWMILPRGANAGAIEPPGPARYNQWGYWAVGDSDEADITCYGQCGPGNFALRLPDYARAGQSQAQRERARFLFQSADPQAVPPGTISAWQSLLDYARAHPGDARSPEALYWLVRISRWGASHDRVGYKAFRLLHTRYPKSLWTRRSPYYYD